MAEERSFANRFNSIMVLMVETHCQYHLYKEASEKNNQEEAEECAKKVNTCRQSIIDIFSEWAVKYQFDMKETIGFMVDTIEELDDVGHAGLADYHRYSLEEFINDITQELYNIHNAIIMNRWTNQLNQKVGIN